MRLSYGPRWLLGIALFVLGILPAFAWQDGSGKPYEGWPHISKNIPRLQYANDPVSPVTVTYLSYRITTAISAEQDGAGSGGQIVDITVQNIKSGKTLKFGDQWAGGRILENYNDYPQIEV